MNIIIRGIINILAVFALAYAVHTIFNFFGVEPSIYIVYLYFFVAMGIFYFVLPRNRVNAFTL